MNADYTDVKEKAAQWGLTPRQVQAVLGENRISADCGPVTVTYAADTEAVIGQGRREDRGMIAPVVAAKKYGL